MQQQQLLVIINRMFRVYRKRVFSKRLWTMQWIVLIGHITILKNPKIILNYKQPSNMINFRMHLPHTLLINNQRKTQDLDSKHNSHHSILIVFKSKQTISSMLLDTIQVIKRYCRTILYLKTSWKNQDPMNLK